MREIDEYKKTTNPEVFKKLRWNLLTSGVLGETWNDCPFCEPHKGCNAFHKKRKGRKRKTFKDWK